MTTSVDDVTTQAAVSAIVAAHRGQRGPLLPIVHAIQAEWGHVPQEVIPLLAQELNLSRADVHGVISFYDDFRREPTGRTTVRICRGEACQAVGAGALLTCARDRTGLSPGETRADGSVTVDQVFCLGNCALGPTVEVNGEMLGRMDADRLRSVLDEAVAS
ncbi:NAD(P)H-dependent oxidoreductase subunit E [Streptomyces sp. B-S-A8]|uniref:NAD(P)H-dependent oxidoreductase subunit E n=1 Tax=Streptomyces solicavernae TaxID=3043614 RepID=A0ABT6RYQ5_9ACTN|nr:NAD(P)H-dependent oxidoreductase subunit E [Streptomyces sp. B-S-A8]MDI3389569.1 NAD(P)H-dependent oxidoreductase subunit E [Streptomyces sp. B-S-A8]